MNLFMHCICSATTEWDIIWKPRERKLGLTSQASVIATPTLCLVMQLSNTPRTSMMESIKTACKKPCSRYDSIILSEPLYTMHIHVVQLSLSHLTFLIIYYLASRLRRILRMGYILTKQTFWQSRKKWASIDRSATSLFRIRKTSREPHRKPDTGPSKGWQVKHFFSL